MLIVTQTSAIVNFDCMETVFAEPEAACFNPGWNIFARGMNRKSLVLGRYKTKEKVEEVMQEIVEKYASAGRRVYRMP